MGKECGYSNKEVTTVSQVLDFELRKFTGHVHIYNLLIELHIALAALFHDVVKFSMISLCRKHRYDSNVYQITFHWLMSKGWVNGAGWERGGTGTGAPFRNKPPPPTVVSKGCVENGMFN